MTSDYGAGLRRARAAAEGASSLDAPGSLADAQAEIARLAQLENIAYELERQAAADRLGIRVAALDTEVVKARPRDQEEARDDLIETIEPWADPVDGASLVEEVRDRLKTHVVFARASDADAAAVWMAGSYLMDEWRLWPRLMITSPTKECGKSTLLETIDALAARGLIVANTKSAGVFRAIEAWHPTLLFDEADAWVKDDLELAGILNSGHTRRTARVIRVEERAGELIPTLFSTWCAMVICGIGEQRDTLTSRSLVISLRRRLPTENVERLPINLHEQMHRVRRQLARWAADNRLLIGSMAVEPPDCDADRRRDNFTPLWRIAAALGGPWPERIASAYALQAAKDDDADEPAGVMALRDLADIFAAGRETRLATETVLHSLLGLEDRPWLEWRHGRPITARSLARLLKPFDVRTRDWRTGGRVVKAYAREEVDASVARYASFHPLQRYSVDNSSENADAIRYTSATCSGSEEGNSHGNQGCSAVADGKPPSDDLDALNDPNDPDAWR